MAGRREVGPIIAKIRDFCNRRAVTNPHRWEFAYQPRDQPAPNLPDGPAHLLSANYYFTRDGRRDLQPATVVMEGGPKALASGAESEGKAVEKRGGKIARPGQLYHWDQ